MLDRIASLESRIAALEDLTKEAAQKKREANEKLVAASVAAEAAAKKPDVEADAKKPLPYHPEPAKR